MEPAIYRGTLRHRRFTPVEHAFTYPLFMVLLDLDGIDETMARSPFTSHNRWNWASFDDRDHFGDPRRRLRERVVADARENGVDLPDGPIYLLTHLRYLGYAFNPVSFYYCFDRCETLCAVLAEVNNTYGGRQNYWLTDHHPVADAPTARLRVGAPTPAARGSSRASEPFVRRYRRRKAMYVSPFMPMDQEYTFAFSQSANRLVAHMTVVRDDVMAFDATLTLDGAPWTGAAVARALLAHPWMTGKVIAAIHWEALRLYVRGVPVVQRPPDGDPQVAGGRVLG